MGLYSGGLIHGGGGGGLISGVAYSRRFTVSLPIKLFSNLKV